MPEFELRCTEDELRLFAARYPIPTSVILHLYYREQYPILDFRALWSLSVDVPGTYKFSFWWSYVEYCRGLAERTGFDMRTLDRALWQYSRENQA